jgi:hypothetical protein
MIRKGVTWPQYGRIVGICWISGVLLGTVVYIASEPSFPWLWLPLALPMASVISLLFAAIAGLFAAILLILLSNHLSRSWSRRSWVALGALSGAAVGALHPVVVLTAIVTRDASFLGSSVVVIPGAVAGAAVGWWYHASILTSPEEALAEGGGMVGKGAL